MFLGLFPERKWRAYVRKNESSKVFIFGPVYGTIPESSESILNFHDWKVRKRVGLEMLWFGDLNLASRAEETELDSDTREELLFYEKNTLKNRPRPLSRFGSRVLARRLNDA